jgi:hypothetical protein
MGAMKRLKYSALRVKPTTTERAKIKIVPVKRTHMTKVTSLNNEKNKHFGKHLAGQ